MIQHVNYFLLAILSYISYAGRFISNNTLVIRYRQSLSQFLYACRVCAKNFQNYNS